MTLFSLIWFNFTKSFYSDKLCIENQFIFNFIYILNAMM